MRGLPSVGYRWTRSHRLLSGLGRGGDEIRGVDRFGKHGEEALVTLQTFDHVEVGTHRYHARTAGVAAGLNLGREPPLPPMPGIKWFTAFPPRQVRRRRSKETHVAKVVQACNIVVNGCSLLLNRERRPMIRQVFGLVLVLPMLAIGLGACDDDDDGPTGPMGPFNFTFQGDGGFQGAHGGQEIFVVVENSLGEIVASESGTVSASEDPSFSFSFPDLLEEGEDYQLKYWIDSNFGGGTAGVCDPPETDHQWSMSISAATDDVTMTDSHRPTETSSVCESFAFNLTFEGDASFQGAHGGQDLMAAVVRTGSDVPGGSMIVATDATVVSSSEDPSFSLSFPGILTLNQQYELHYWIDSNFGGGTAGTCDPPENDHQWSLEFGPVTDDVVQADTHRPTETESVCSTFE